MKICFWLAPVAFCLSAWGQTYLIYTAAGNGVRGYSGDNGPATSAQLALPGAVAFDSKGNMYIADSANNVVRKVAGGVITTIAGNNTSGYKGDKGPATSAQLSNPTGVAVDSSGNIYIADANNNVVRMVSSSGTITTFAGNNTPGFAGDTGAATAAELNVPVAVAVDSKGTVYIADSNNNAIRVVSGGKINSLPMSSAYLYHPVGVAVDAAGDVFVADTGNQRVVEFAAGTSAFSVIAGTGVPGFGGDNGPGTNALLLDPEGVAVDAAGYVYIADTMNSRIRKVALDGTITTIAGTGTPAYGGEGQYATTAPLYFPHALAFDASGNLNIADTYNSAIRMLTLLTPAANAVVNSASFVPQISPGALASISGVNLSSGKASAQTPLPLSLAGVTVAVNGRPAPILYVQPTLINFQVPWEVQPGPGSVVVTINGVSAPPVNVSIGSAAPGIFLLSAGSAAIENSDGSINTPSNPAKTGTLISVYMTGSGPVNPQPADGAVSGSNPYSVLTAPYSAVIGQTPASIQFAGLAPGSVGLVQINVRVPPGLQATTYPLSITINGETSNVVAVSVTP